MNYKWDPEYEPRGWFNTTKGGMYKHVEMIPELQGKYRVHKMVNDTISKCLDEQLLFPYDKFYIIIELLENIDDKQLDRVVVEVIYLHDFTRDPALDLALGFSPQEAREGMSVKTCLKKYNAIINNDILVVRIFRVVQ